MFDPVLAPGAECDVTAPPGRDMASAAFRVRGRLWNVVEIEAMWREWMLGRGDAGGDPEGVIDVELWRVRVVPGDGHGSDVVLVLGHDLAFGRWFVHSVWD